MSFSITAATTPMHEAAFQGHLDTVKVLVELRADINVQNDRGYSPLSVALRNGNINISTFLVNIGADVKICLQSWGLKEEVSHIREMLSQFCESVGLPKNGNDDDYEESDEKCSLFSLTKLMSSASPDDDTRALFETTIGISLRHLVISAVLKKMHETPYALKRRLVRIAWRVYQSSLLMDGDRLTVSAKVRRYTELVCFLFGLTMLGDVLALRMTCKSNNERRRFPVHIEAAYHELEANIIEMFVAYDSSRFVSTDVIHAVMAIHKGSFFNYITLHYCCC
jgi:hypothetical protein